MEQWNRENGIQDREHRKYFNKMQDSTFGFQVVEECWDQLYSVSLTNYFF